MNDKWINMTSAEKQQAILLILAVVMAVLLISLLVFMYVVLINRFAKRIGSKHRKMIIEKSFKLSKKFKKKH